MIAIVTMIILIILIIVIVVVVVVTGHAQSGQLVENVLENVSVLWCLLLLRMMRWLLHHM